MADAPVAQTLEPAILRADGRQAEDQGGTHSG
jgi:hypothetical protein